MAHDDTERDRAVRAMLVDRVSGRSAARGVLLKTERFRVGIVTAVMLVAIVALSMAAVRFGADRGAPATGGLGTTVVPPTALPTASIPAGKVLGRFTSDDGPDQTHTIQPDGLAIAAVFECSGIGDYSVSISHDSEFAAITPAGRSPGSCAGNTGSSGNKGHAGSAVVTIRSAATTRWTLTIVGIPETYVTPRPIPTPTDTAGTAVPYCTADDLDAVFLPRTMPKGVTEVSGGEIRFTNRTASTCALAGYPEVRFLDAGEPLGDNTMNHGDERSSTEDGLHAVVLRPGGAAYSQIDWYLKSYYPENEEGTCVARTVTEVQVDLAYDLSSPGQTGTLTVPIGRATACLNGAHGALGKYGQLSSTVFVDYSLREAD